MSEIDSSGRVLIQEIEQRPFSEKTDNELEHDSSSESSDVDEESFLPLEIQEKLKNCLHKDLVPDIMTFLSLKIPKMYGIETKNYPLETLVYPPFDLDSAFSREDQYDLFQMVDILTFPQPRYFKSEAQVSVGAAIRISKAIGKVEHADKLNQIVKGCITPEESPDLADDGFGYAYMNWRAKGPLQEL